MGQVRPADPRADAVGRNEDVSFSCGPVRDVCAQAAARALLVMGELLADMHHVYKAGKQDLAEGETVHGSAVRAHIR